jgi:HK97 family phage portal protein
MFDRIKSFFAPEGKSMAMPLSSPDVLGFFNLPPNSSGVVVDATAALRVPAVQNGVRLISEAVATLDAKLYQTGADGRTMIERGDHSVARVLERPNPWTGETEFKRQLIQDMLIWGNGLALVTRVRGEVRELHRIDPRACSITIDLDTTEPVYTVALQNGGSRTFTYKDVIHLRNVTIDGARGLGIVNLGTEPIGLSLVLERHASATFSRGAKPSGVLQYDGMLTKETAQRLKASFDANHSGIENTGRTLLLEGGVKFSPQQINSTDGQFIENRKFQVIEIARLLKLPPYLLGDLEHATHNNSEELGDQFLSFTVLPILELFEDAIERTLLTEEERDAGYEVEFDTSNFTRADTEKRFAAYKSGIESGVLTLNDARKREGLPPVDGGDAPMRSVQTIPLEAIDPAMEEAEPTPAQTQTPIASDTGA